MAFGALLMITGGVLVAVSPADRGEAGGHRVAVPATPATLVDPGEHGMPANLVAAEDEDAIEPEAPAEDESPPTPAATLLPPVAGFPPEVAEASAVVDQEDADPGTPAVAAAAAPGQPAADPAEHRPPPSRPGGTGIVVDGAVMGAGYERHSCTGVSDTFSIARDRQVSLCLRVVHPPQEESVEVLWQRNGATVRRDRLRIPAHQQYRTRAYMTVRDHHQGQWTAKVLSGDGLELASTAFVIVE